jgi:hypothetical protein
MKLEYAKSSLYSISCGVRGKSSTDYFKVDDAITWGGWFLVPNFQALSTPISQFAWHCRSHILVADNVNINIFIFRMETLWKSEVAKKEERRVVRGKWLEEGSAEDWGGEGGKMSLNSELGEMSRVDWRRWTEGAEGDSLSSHRSSAESQRSSFELEKK